MKYQRGGFVIGLIVGLVIGLFIALAVAMYVVKVPGPFVDKVPQHSAEQDAAEAEKNKHWDPNSPLYGKNPARPQPATEPASSAASTAASAVSSAASAAAAASQAQQSKDPAVILGEKPASQAASAATKEKDKEADTVVYYIQVGAFSHIEEAEAQRAKLAMMNIDTQMSERDQGSHTIYRVRVGPFNQRVLADEVKTRLTDHGIESVLVRASR